jgi:hypothetical protein
LAQCLEYTLVDAAWAAGFSGDAVARIERDLAVVNSLLGTPSMAPISSDDAVIAPVALSPAARVFAIWRPRGVEVVPGCPHTQPLSTVFILFMLFSSAVLAVLCLLLLWTICCDDPFIGGTHVQCGPPVIVVVHAVDGTPC